ncbi:large conductance mechanosensitive channel protein MscL [Pseudonocardia sp. DW16-2]|uniref:Large-conductance mechanosensitive channel n=1 Tax=Pseudonocardia spirodelae TaxID=3133431 RepID=A0ABU8T4H4_9PSEU
MLKGFKEFLLRGNVIDLAVAVVIGAAFTAVVTAFTRAFLEPLLRLFSGGEDAVPPGTIPLTDEVQLDYASFLNAVITFLITAAVIYFLVVFPMKWLQERRRQGEDTDVPETDSELLGQIRDLLLEQAERERERAAAPPAPMPPAPPLPGRPPAGPLPGPGPFGPPPGHAAQPAPRGPVGVAEDAYEPYPDTPRRSRHRS